MGRAATAWPCQYCHRCRLTDRAAVVVHLLFLQVPVATLAKALPMLLDVLLLCLFAFFVFGIVAVQLFAGALRNRCVCSYPCGQQQPLQWDCLLTAGCVVPRLCLCKVTL